MSRLSQFLSYSSLVLALTGNTVGALANMSTGTVVLAGGPGVTLSQAGQTVTISAGAGAGFSGGVSNLGNTSGQTGVTGTRLVLAGLNNVTLSQATDANGATVSISGPSTLPATNFSGGVSNLGNTSGQTGVTGTRLVLAGGNNVTLSQATDANGGTVTISGATTAAQTAESQTFGVSNLGNTVGTSGVISGPQLRMILAGGNNVTLSQSLNGSSATITISAASQSAESNTLGISNLGNTSGTSGVISGNQLRLLFAGGNNVTLSQSINGSSATITISAFNQSAQPSSAFSAGISTGGNTSGSTGLQSSQLVLVGGNNITLSGSTAAGGLATVTISAFTQSAESNTFGVSNLGNTSGTSGVISGNQLRMIVVGTNNITISQSLNGSSATLSISGANQTAESQTLGISNLGNTSGTSGVISGNQLQLILAGGNNVTLSQSINGSSATITISVPNVPGGETIDQWPSFFTHTQQFSTLGIGTVHLHNMPVPHFFTADRVVLRGSNSVSSSSNSSHAGSLTFQVGLYSRTGSTLSLATSGSQTWAWTNTSSNSINSLNNARIYTVPMTISATPGNYWVGIWSSTQSANANWITLSNDIIKMQAMPINVVGHFLSNTASSIDPMLGAGIVSVSSTILPSSIALSDIFRQPQGNLPWFQFINGTY